MDTPAPKRAPNEQAAATTEGRAFETLSAPEKAIAVFAALYHPASLAAVLDMAGLPSEALEKEEAVKLTLLLEQYADLFEKTQALNQAKTTLLRPAWLTNDWINQTEEAWEAFEEKRRRLFEKLGVSKESAHSMIAQRIMKGAPDDDV